VCVRVCLCVVYSTVSPVNTDSGIRTHSTSVTLLSYMWGPRCFYAAVSSLKTELANDRLAYGRRYRVFTRVMAHLLVHTAVHSSSSGVHRYFRDLEVPLKILGARILL